jgi:hypothetical protein
VPLRRETLDHVTRLSKLDVKWNANWGMSVLTPQNVDRISHRTVTAVMGKISPVLRDWVPKPHQKWALLQNSDWQGFTS